MVMVLLMLDYSLDCNTRNFYELYGHQNEEHKLFLGINIDGKITFACLFFQRLWNHGMSMYTRHNRLDYYENCWIPVYLASNKVR